MKDFASYVFYVNRPDLLVRAIKSFPQLTSELTVVNNSGKELHEVLSSDDMVECCFKAMDILEPPVPLSYSQSMNWMLKDAIARQVDFIFHFHSDAFSTNPTAADELLAYARKVRDEGRRWACLWSYYDIAWIINPKAAEAVGGWDTNLPSYYTDNCMRHRWLLANYETIDTHIQGISHEGSATINSDSKLSFLNGQMMPLWQQYYRAKWGGMPGEERYCWSFNRPDLFPSKEKS